MKISIDTDQDTYETAIRAVSAAYGVPFDPSGVVWHVEEDEDDDSYLPNHWTPKRLRELVHWLADSPAAVALKFMAQNAPAVSLEDTFAHLESEFPDWAPIDGKKMGGIMSAVGHARNSIGGGVTGPYETDYNSRKYRLDVRIATALLGEFDALDS